MIDIENRIIDTLIDKLRAEFGDIYVYGEVPELAAGYPCVTVMEMNNSIAAHHIDSGGYENAVDLMYEVTVYSDLTRGKKEQAKKIRSFISDVLTQMGFVRTLSQPVPDLNDAAVYRIVSRFEARADGIGIYRR
ncbi:MAG: hypothetical protein IJ740_06080 [Ruminococcus sp.]|nr:hypothetical protein [Ruminococcus sp.]